MYIDLLFLSFSLLYSINTFEKIIYFSAEKHAEAFRSINEEINRARLDEETCLKPKNNFVVRVRRRRELKSKRKLSDGCDYQVSR